MTSTMPRAWETSKAYYDWIGESKDNTLAMLFQWGSKTNSQWPDDARFVSLAEWTDPVVCAQQCADKAPRSIVKRIPGWKLRELFPVRDWKAYTHDVYFFELTRGNVQRAGDAPSMELGGIIIGSNAIRYVRLGCNHPDTKTIKTANCYREFACNNCGYTWGEDSSG